ncbi:unnamed protein product, partial [Mesorhabditis spiculigera]
MNNYFIYGSLEDTPKYSCRNATPEPRNPNLPLGVFYIVTGFVVQLAYLASLLGIGRKENIQYPAYKLMFALAIFDLMNIFDCGYWMGYFTIYGFHFCDRPTEIYLTGLYCELFYNSASLTSVSLLFNRLLDVAECRYRDLLFKHPVVFNPDYGTFIFVPLIPGNMDHEYNFDRQTWLNMFVCVSLGTFSCLIYVIQWRKEKLMSIKMGSYRKQVLRQAILVSFFVFTSSLIWTMLVFIPPGAFAMAMMHIGHISWMLMHSTPALIYLSFNETIRSNVRRLSRMAPTSRICHTSTGGAGGPEIPAPNMPA